MLPIHGIITKNTLDEYLDYSPHDVLSLYRDAYACKLPLINIVFITDITNQYFLNTTGLREVIKNRLLKLDPTSEIGFKEVTDSIQKLIIKTPIPSRLLQGFHEIYDRYLHHQYVLVSPLQPNSLYQSHLTKPVQLYSGDAAILHAVRQTWSQAITPTVLRQWSTKKLLNDFRLPLINIYPIPPASFSGIIETIVPGKNRHTHAARLSVAPGYDYLFAGHKIIPESYLLDYRAKKIISSKPQSQISKLVIDRHGHFKTVSLIKNSNSEVKLSKPLINQCFSITQTLNNYLLKPSQCLFVADSSTLTLIHLSLPLSYTTIPANSKKVTTIQLPRMGQGTSISPGIVSGPFFPITATTKTDIPRGAIIFIPKKQDLKNLSLLNTISGIISENSSFQSTVAFNARELRIPMVSQPTWEVDMPVPHTLITLDGKEGAIFAGSMQANPNHAPNLSEYKSHKLATKLFINVNDTSNILNSLTLPHDGICTYSGDSVRKKVWLDTRIYTTFLRDYPDILLRELSALSKLTGHKQIFYNLSLQMPLPAGLYTETLSVQEAVATIIENPALTTIECNTLSKLRHQNPQLKLIVALPVTPDLSQILFLKRLLATENLVRSVSFKLAANISTPAAIQELKSLIDFGIDYVIVDVNKLAYHYFGIHNHDAALPSAFHEPFSSYMSGFIKRAVQANLPVILKGAILNSQSDYILDAVNAGVWAISCSPETIPMVHDRLAFAESRLTKNKDIV